MGKKDKGAYRDGDGERALEAARAATSPIVILGSFNAKDGRHGTDKAFAFDAESEYQSLLGEGNPSLTDGASQWVDTDGWLEIRVVIGNVCVKATGKRQSDGVVIDRLKPQVPVVQRTE